MIHALRRCWKLSLIVDRRRPLVTRFAGIELLEARLPGLLAVWLKPFSARVCYSTVAAGFASRLAKRDFVRAALFLWISRLAAA